MNIDTVDYAILKIIEDYEDPLWKNRIYELLTEQTNELPDVESVSVQTIGRRVDDLRDQKILSSCIISPEDIKRDLIIAFKLTEKGEQAINTKREELLGEAVKQQIFAENNQIVEKPVLVELIRSHFNLNSNTKQELMEEYSREELTTFLTLYYIKRHATDVFTDGSVEKIANLAQQSEEIEGTLGNNMLEEKIAEKLG